MAVFCCGCSCVMCVLLQSCWCSCVVAVAATLPECTLDHHGSGRPAVVEEGRIITLPLLSPQTLKTHFREGVEATASHAFYLNKSTRP